MFLASDSAVLREEPGRGKRAMSPPPPGSSRKHLKTSRNPLLSGNTNEDTWSVSLLKASDNDSQSEEDKEFDFPPALEAFAEKIGIGLNQEWSDLKEATAPAPAPSLVPAPAPAPSPWLQDYAVPPTVPEEDVWWEVSVSPTELEEGQMEQDVTRDLTTSNIPENEKLTEADNSSLAAFWRPGLESLLSGNDPMADVEGQTFDLLEFAMGESGVGLDEEAALTGDEPAKTPLDIDEDHVPDLTKIKAEPAEFVEFVEMKPVENVSIEVIEEIEESPGKRKAGRPLNHDPITVTVIPQACKLSYAELKALKYRRTRDLNNKASRRFRVKKKEQEEQFLQELRELQDRNSRLQLTASSLEKEVVQWRARVSNIKL